VRGFSERHNPRIETVDKRAKRKEVERARRWNIQAITHLNNERGAAEPRKTI
jgi:hypothetical protein